MRRIPWILVGFALGTLASTAVGQTYHGFFQGGQVLNKDEDLRLGHAAGAFDMFETIVRLSNKYPDVWTRSKQTQQYRCMDRHGRKLSDHLEWAERVWKQNLTEYTTDTMFLLACIGIR